MEQNAPLFFYVLPKQYFTAIILNAIGYLARSVSETPGRYEGYFASIYPPLAGNQIYTTIHAAVAQWIRALVYGTRCRRFESCQPRHSLTVHKGICWGLFTTKLIINPKELANNPDKALL